MRMLIVSNGYTVVWRQVIDNRTLASSQIHLRFQGFAIATFAFSGLRPPVAFANGWTSRGRKGRRRSGKWRSRGDGRLEPASAPRCGTLIAGPLARARCAVRGDVVPHARRRHDCARPHRTLNERLAQF